MLNKYNAYVEGAKKVFFSWASMIWSSIKLCNPIWSKDIECRLWFSANDFDFLWFCSTCPAKSLIDINYDEKSSSIRNWWKVFWNSKYAWSINMMHPHALSSPAEICNNFERQRESESQKSNSLLQIFKFSK